MTLGEMGHWFGGGTPSKARADFWTNGDIPWVSPKDMKTPKIHDAQDHITEAAVKGSSTSLVPAGSVLVVVRSGILKHTLPVAITEREVALNQDLKAITPNENVLPEYLALGLKAFERRILDECCKDGTTVQNIKMPSFLRFELPVPPLPEQRRIVARIEELFSRLDAGVAALRHAKAQLQRYRQSVLAAAVTGQLTQAWREQKVAEASRLSSSLNVQRQDASATLPYESAEELLKRILKQRREQWNGRRKYNEPIAPAVADLPEIPESWTWSSPAQLSAPEDYSLAIGPFGSNLKVSDYTDAGVPLVFVRHIRANDYELTPKFVSEEKASELRAHSVDPGDLLVTKMGEPPGDSSLYPENRPHAIITADCIKLRLTHLIASKSFFVNAINSQLVAKQIAPITRGVAQKKISLDRFRDIALPLPPLAEQHQIVAEVEARTTAIDHLETELDRQITRSNRLRQSILCAAFRGRLVYSK
jgi:type I restriction enzyme S subunit